MTISIVPQILVVIIAWSEQQDSRYQCILRLAQYAPHYILITILHCLLSLVSVKITTLCVGRTVYAVIVPYWNILEPCEILPQRESVQLLNPLQPLIDRVLNIHSWHVKVTKRPCAVRLVFFCSVGRETERLAVEQSFDNVQQAESTRWHINTWRSRTNAETLKGGTQWVCERYSLLDEAVDCLILRWLSGALNVPFIGLGVTAYKWYPRKVYR